MSHSLRELVLEAFANGYGVHSGNLSDKARGTCERVVDLVQRYAPLAAECKAAGIAVIAPTGRVLMLQRSLNDLDDPARGTWEMPGGCLEPGESPWEAAKREWEEETGNKLPVGHVVDSWVSDNHIYQGFLYSIAAESDVVIQQDFHSRAVTNPDSDGDEIEALAWWDPKDLPELPSLRSELRYMDWSIFGSIPKQASLDTILHSTNLFAFSEAIGELEGLRNKLFQRRDRVWLRYDTHSRSWARQFAQRVPVDRLANSVIDAYHKVHLVQEDSGTNNQAQRAAVKAAAAALLYHVLSDHSDIDSQGRTLVNSALTDGSAEGVVSAQAMVAKLRGHALPDLNTLKASQLAKIQNAGSYWMSTPQAVRDQVDGLAGDLALKVVALMGSGATEQEVEDAIQATLNAGDGVAFYLDQAIHSAYIKAQISSYKTQNVSQYNWVTAGDDRVCFQCLADEAGSPYTIDNGPLPPQHGACRCVTEPF